MAKPAAQIIFIHIESIGQLLQRNCLPLIIAKVLLMMGMMSMVVAATVEFKNLLPDNQNGQFEGVRMVFVDLIPMVIGPSIGSLLINLFGIDAMINGKEAVIPTPVIYVACAVCACLGFIALFMLKKHQKEAEE